MNKIKFGALLFGLVAVSLHAAVDSVQVAEAVEEDIDLFRKDKPVYFINAEFLYWRVNEGATDFALKSKHAAWSTVQDTYAIGHFKNADFDWSPGFRVSVGYFNAPRYWDMMLQYTSLHVGGEKVVHAPHSSSHFLIGTWIEPDFKTDNTAVPLHRAKSGMDFHYHVLDWLFARRFQTNPHFRLNLFGGLTSAFLRQVWKVHYTDLQNNHSKIRNSWDFAGIGMRIGARVDWYLGWDLYLTGLTSAALISGFYENKAHQKTHAPVAGADNSRPFRNTHFNDTRLAGTAQLLAGFSWQKAYQSVRTDFFAGYEFNYWSNLHEVYRSSRAGAGAGKDTFINHSNIALQGLTARASLDF